ncbi:Unknown protein [Striga hermonthica]|uniref:DUF4283 domain-containing protein n=1 Tax=Striga hermonthica TaxID=68872 RepID=A0A9N7NNK8_STRHE|nr:Unknown protein [Striga hermonthica]
MEEELGQKLESVSIAEAENLVIDIEPKDVSISAEECNRILFGNHGDRKANWLGLQRTMGLLWKIRNSLEVREISSNYFQFIFPTRNALLKIDLGRSWMFENQHLILTEWTKGLSGSHEKFGELLIWVQVYMVLINWLSTDVGLKIERAFKGIRNVNLAHVGNGGGRIIRIQVVLDMNQPLPRWSFIRLGQYGDWLRAPEGYSLTGSPLASNNSEPSSSGKQSVENFINKSQSTSSGLRNADQMLGSCAMLAVNDPNPTSLIEPGNLLDFILEGEEHKMEIIEANVQSLEKGKEVATTSPNQRKWMRASARVGKKATGSQLKSSHNDPQGAKRSRLPLQFVNKDGTSIGEEGEKRKKGGRFEDGLDSEEDADVNPRRKKPQQGGLNEILTLSPAHQNEAGTSRDRKRNRSPLPEADKIYLPPRRVNTNRGESLLSRRQTKAYAR